MGSFLRFWGLLAPAEHLKMWYNSLDSCCTVLKPSCATFSQHELCIGLRNMLSLGLLCVCTAESQF